MSLDIKCKSIYKKGRATSCQEHIIYHIDHPLPGDYQASFKLKNISALKPSIELINVRIQSFNNAYIVTLLILKYIALITSVIVACFFGCRSLHVDKLDRCLEYDTLKLISMGLVIYNDPLAIVGYNNRSLGLSAFQLVGTSILFGGLLYLWLMTINQFKYFGEFLTHKSLQI